MTEAQFDSIDQTLRQLVSGQEVVVGRLDRIDGRLDGIDNRLDGMDSRLDRMDGRLDSVDRRLDKLEINYETMLDEVRLLGEQNVGTQQAMARGFNDLREDFDRRLGPVETAIRRLFGAESP